MLDVACIADSVRLREGRPRGSEAGGGFVWEKWCRWLMGRWFRVVMLLVEVGGSGGSNEDGGDGLVCGILGLRRLSLGCVLFCHRRCRIHGGVLYLSLDRVELQK